MTKLDDKKIVNSTPQVTTGIKNMTNELVRKTNDEKKTDLVSSTKFRDGALKNNTELEKRRK